MLFFILLILFSIFFFNDTATTEIYTLSLHDALPIFPRHRHPGRLLDQSRHQAILSSTRERFSGAASATTTAPPAATIAAGILPASSVQASKSVSPRRTGSPGRLCSTIPAAALTGSSLRARPAPRRHAATPSI